MTVHDSQDRRDSSPRDCRQGGFLRWSSSRYRAHRSAPDPGFVVDRRQLYKYLDSLEGLSGQ